MLPLRVKGEQQRPSTKSELCEWMNALSHSIGSGLVHRVETIDGVEVIRLYHAKGGRLMGQLP